MTKRLLIVQFAGDFREAWCLRERTGGETYYGHGYILDELARLATKHGEAGFLCGTAPPYCEKLPTGATVLGAGADAYKDPRAIIAAIERFDPTHLIVHGPMVKLLRWSLGRDLPLGCLLADSFLMNPLERWWRFAGLSRALNDPGISLVANHGVNAARNLVEIGVAADKVIAWDFPHLRTPDGVPARTAPPPRSCNVFYVGSIGRKKGVGDLIEAAARLRDRFDVKVRIAGAGKIELFRAQARRLGIADQVEFLGLVPNSRVSELMREADLVVVPSRLSFPEGLPLTLYEALASRTPTIASSHPMFTGHLVDGESAAIYPAGDAHALADRIAAVLSDPALYQRLSHGAREAWHRMQIPVKWGTMIDHWVSGDEADRTWLASHTLSGGGQAS